jgi:hypothetical protein
MGVTSQEAMLSFAVPITHLGEFPGNIIDYDGQIVNDSLALILHPTLSSTAITLKQCAHDVVNGTIPTKQGTTPDGVVNILTPFQHLFLNNI